MAIGFATLLLPAKYFLGLAAIFVFVPVNNTSSNFHSGTQKQKQLAPVPYPHKAIFS